MKNITARKLICFLSSLCLIFGGAAIFYAVRSEGSDSRIGYSYDQAYEDLTACITGLETSIQKLSVARSQPMTIRLASDIWRVSKDALRALADLPIENQKAEKTAKYLAQTGEYAYSLMYGEYAAENSENLRRLGAVCSGLVVELQGIRDELREGTLLMLGEQDSLSDRLYTLEDEFADYGTLNYDGPYSDHIEQITPRFISTLEAVDEDQARRAAASFIGIDPQLLGEGYLSGDKIKSYVFSDNNGKTIAVTVQGAIPYHYWDEYQAGEAVLNTEQGIEKASDFLNSRGFENMQASYYTLSGGLLSINFHYQASGITIYPDLITVTVSLDNGTVVAFDAEGYIMNHTARSRSTPQITLTEARAKLDQSYEILKEGLAVIATPGKNEVLCYEFVCQSPSSGQIVFYLDADTGDERDIQLLYEDEGGKLAI